MKKITILILYAALISSCNNLVRNSPKTVVASFIEAAKKGDMESLKKYITSQDLALLQMGENFIAKLDSSAVREMKDKMSAELRNKTGNAQIDIKDEKIEGDNATVNVHFKIYGKENLQPFLLKKEEGQWKISMSSTGMNNTGMSKGNMEEGMTQLNEGLKNMDGLKDSINKAMKAFKNINTDSLKKIIDGNKEQLDKIKEAINQ